MKKFLSVVFIACLLQAGFLGCIECDGCGELPNLEPFYINNSGVSVTITFIEENNDYYNYRYTRQTQEIKNNDTLCNYYLNESCSRWYVPHGYENYCDFIPHCAKPGYFKIEFLSEPKVCLIFDGDAKIGDNDIRYWENYTFVKKGSMIIYYSYTITQEHKDMAKEEYCEE